MARENSATPPTLSLPLIVHIAVPQHKIFTLQLWTSLQACGTFPALVEFIEINIGMLIEEPEHIDISKYKLVGLATYGPTSEDNFQNPSIMDNVTSKRLITTDQEYQAWKSTINPVVDEDNIEDQLKIAVILWDPTLPESDKKTLRWPLYEIKLLSGREMTYKRLQREKARYEFELEHYGYEMNETGFFVGPPDGIGIEPGPDIDAQWAIAGHNVARERIAELDEARARHGQDCIRRLAFSADEQAEHQKALDAWSVGA